jgi:phosphohistidine phosphatase
MRVKLERVNKKTLYLVRHAKSSWKDASLSDLERPLNKRGRRNSPEMGRRLAAQGHVPGLIISSPANRAITTARNIAIELGLDESEIITDDGLYFSGTNGMLNVLETVEDHYDNVMMVGHNPTMNGCVEYANLRHCDHRIRYDVMGQCAWYHW